MSEKPAGEGAREKTLKIDIDPRVEELLLIEDRGTFLYRAQEALEHGLTQQDIDGARRLTAAIHSR